MSTKTIVIIALLVIAAGFAAYQAWNWYVVEKRKQEIRNGAKQIGSAIGAFLPGGSAWGEWAGGLAGDFFADMQT